MKIKGFSLEMIIVFSGFTCMFNSLFQLYMSVYLSKTEVEEFLFGLLLIGYAAFTTFWWPKNRVTAYLNGNRQHKGQLHY